MAGLCAQQTAAAAAGCNCLQEESVGTMMSTAATACTAHADPGLSPTLPQLAAYFKSLLLQLAIKMAGNNALAASMHMQQQAQYAEQRAIDARGMLFAVAGPSFVEQTLIAIQGLARDDGMVTVTAAARATAAGSNSACGTDHLYGVWCAPTT
jgi:hypothetical protein